MIKNKPFEDALKNFQTELQREEKLLAEMKAVVETVKPFINGEFISRQKYKKQKLKVENLRVNNK